MKNLNEKTTHDVWLESYVPPDPTNLSADYVDHFFAQFKELFEARVYGKITKFDVGASVLRGNEIWISSEPSPFLFSQNRDKCVETIRCWLVKEGWTSDDVIVMSCNDAVRVVLYGPGEKKKESCGLC